MAVNLGMTNAELIDSINSDLGNVVTLSGDQIISGIKQFLEIIGIQFVADTNQQTVPTANTSRILGLYRNATYTKGDGFTSWVDGIRRADGRNSSILYVRRFLESDNNEILNFVSVDIRADGIPCAYTITPPIDVNDREIVTAGWINSKMQVVSTLPANPDPNVFYFIPG